MKALKNISVGFLVSFIGSIPLGFINIAGFQIYKKSGIDSVISYLFGVISVEFFVIYFTLIFARQLSNNKRLIKFIDCFSIFFMLLLAYSFYFKSNMDTSSKDYLLNISASPYFIGVVLSCFNFIQLPFWTGWNLYLINAEFIYIQNKVKYFYLFAALIGTFSGMLTLILGLDLVVRNSEILSKHILSTLIPLVFIGMAIFQTYKFYKKYSVSKN